MPIKIRRTFKSDQLVSDTLARMKPVFEAALIDEATEISTRARAGKLITGSNAKQLSPEYKKRKIKSGRRGVPDFTFSGAMLAAIQSKVLIAGESLIGRIFFSSAKEAAKAEGNQKIRPFFGLSLEQLQRIKTRLKEALRK